MKIRYDFFKEVMQGKYTNIIFSTPQMFGMICQAIKILFQELTCMVIFFLQHQFKSKELGRGWGTRPLKLPVNVRKTHPCASFIKITF